MSVSCFIAIDSMLERIRCEGTVDVYGHVTCLRAQRNYMVQTEDQVRGRGRAERRCPRGGAALSGFSFSLFWYQNIHKLGKV